MLDNKDVNAILAKLEDLEDEELAVELLREFNSASKTLGQLILNMDKTITHEEWKSRCDVAQKALDKVVKRINDL